MNGDPSAVRGALVIVLAGAALGMVYNGMALRSHPPHGIPWIAVKEELPTLVDSIASVPISEPPAPEASPPAPQTSSAPAHPAAPATATHPAAKPPSSGAAGTTAAPGTTPAPAASGSSSSSAPPITNAPDAHLPVPLPFIPESDKPIQVQLATAKKFFVAKAALFVDARDPAEYEAGHIPGAVRLTGPEANTDPEKIKALPVQGRPIICYCEGGACEASLDLAKTLIDNGFKKVLVYMGGFPEWSADNQPVEKGAGK